MFKKLLILSLFFFASVLIYGYWSSRTHGYFYLTLNTPSKKILNAKIQLLDENKEILVEGLSDDTYGIVYTKHPNLGYCDKLEKNKPYASEIPWNVCFNEKSRWILQWAPKAKYINIFALPDCQFQLLPLDVKIYTDDWWLWWVPLPHQGGKPMTYFNFEVPDLKKLDCSN